MRKYFKMPAAGEWQLNWRQLSGYSFGGMIGSGWLLSANATAYEAGNRAWISWIIGGVVMMIIAIVLTELARRWKKDGGLVWWPFMSSGPLVAMITVAAIWIIYALSPASEATAAVEFGSHWFPWLYSPPPPGNPVGGQLTWPGFGVAAVLVGLLIATSLLTLRLITSFTVVASAVKVVVPVIVLVLLIRSGFGTGNGMECTAQKSSFSNILTAVTSGGVIYTYTGFQAPIDFGGHTRASARSSRLTVIVPIAFGILLLTLLQVFSVQDRIFGTEWSGIHFDSPYVGLAATVAIWHLSLEWLISLDTIASPLACGVVFVTALTFIINSLVGEDMVPAVVGPQREAESRRWASRKILVVNFVISMLFLLFLRDWSSLVEESCIIFVFSYAAPSVSLFALILHDSPPGQRVWAKARELGLPGLLAPLSFVLMTFILYEADIRVLAISIGVVLGMTAALVYLRPATWRARKQPQWTNSLRLGLLLIAYLCAVTVLCALRDVTSGRAEAVVCCGVLTVLLGFWAFFILVRESIRYMRVYPPPDSEAS
jgi:amino acid transporter